MPPASEPSKLPGGLTLPPLEETLAEASAARRPAREAEQTAARPPAPSLLGPFLLGLFVGLLAGVMGAYYFYLVQIVPELQLAQQHEGQLTRHEETLLDLESQLTLLREQQFTMQDQLAEARTVIANVTIQTSNLLSEERGKVARAQAEIEAIKVEEGLNDLNQELAAANLPLAFEQVEVTESTVKLTVLYWGLRVSDIHALGQLQRLRERLGTLFPRKTFPTDYHITFRHLTTGQTTVSNGGKWETPGHE